MTKRPITHSLLVVTVALCAVAGLFGVATAQDAGAPATPNPVVFFFFNDSVSTEIYIVSLVTLDDGSREERFTAATSAIPGQVIEYRIFATNTGETTLPAGRIQVLGPVQDGMEFVAGSATPSSERVLTEFSADGAVFGVQPILVGTGEDRRIVEPAEFKAVRWTLLVPMEPGQEEPFFYRVTLL